MCREESNKNLRVRGVSEVSLESWGSLVMICAPVCPIRVHQGSSPNADSFALEILSHQV